MRAPLNYTRVDFVYVCASMRCRWRAEGRSMFALTFFRPPFPTQLRVDLPTTRTEAEI